MEYPDYGPLQRVYVLEPDYPEYLAPSNDDIPVEDRPLPADASPAVLSPGYSSEDDDDKEEKHLAHADSTAIASPAVDHAPLGYRAAGIRLRAASPLPLSAPSTSRIVDIHEADIPPRKRVDYSFVDTIDASIQAFERRTMAVIEVVNWRVSYQADVRRQKSEDFYTRH
nr:hypothetical protein [Tanacetum cinerariifolium]